MKILGELINNIVTGVIQLIEVIKKNGKSIALWVAMLILFTITSIYIVYQNQLLFNYYISKSNEIKETEKIEQQQQHINNVQNRRDINNKVHQELYRFFYSHACVQDIAIMEYHNTVSNLANTSFLFVSNTFELCKNGDSHFSDIQHVNISLFNMGNILYSNRGRYNNTITNLRIDDSKLYSLIYNIKDGKHVYIIELTTADNNIPIGALIVISNDEYSVNLDNTIVNLSNKLSILLS